MIIKIPTGGSLTPWNIDNHYWEYPEFDQVTPDLTSLMGHLAVEFEVESNGTGVKKLYLLWVEERSEWVLISYSSWVESMAWPPDESYGGPYRLDSYCERKLAQVYDLDACPERIREISPEGLVLLTIRQAKSKGLPQVDLSKKRIKQLSSEIGQLTQLRRLYLNENQLTSLPPALGDLIALQELKVRRNNLSDLPAEIVRLRNLQTLDLRDNPLPLPPELLAQVDAPWVIIREWLDYISGRTLPLNETKLVLVGEAYVGKTSLVDRLLYDTFDSESNKTEGIAIHQWRTEIRPSNGEQKTSSIRVNIWDFGGSVRSTSSYWITASMKLRIA